MTKYYLYTIIGLIIGSFVLFNLWRNEVAECNSIKATHSEYLDSCLVILNTPPRVIKVDSIIYKDTTVVKWMTRYKEAPASAITVKDSIINDSIDVRVFIKADSVYSIDWQYKTIKSIVTRDVIKYIPKKVFITKETKVSQRGLFLSAGIGFADSFTGKVGVSYLDKKSSLYSLDYIKYGNDNIYMVSYGMKLR